MNILVGVALGLSLTIFGFLILLKLNGTTKKLVDYYQKKQIEYNERFYSSPKKIKILAFLFLGPSYLTKNEGEIKFFLLFFSLSFIVLGIMEILLVFKMII